VGAQDVARFFSSRPARFGPWRSSISKGIGDRVFPRPRYGLDQCPELAAVVRRIDKGLRMRPDPTIWSCSMALRQLLSA
jgi:hypothetical protein